jgi:hypothetical protein
MLTEADVRINSLPGIFIRDGLAIIAALRPRLPRKITAILSENTSNLMLATSPLAWYALENVVVETG